MIQRRQTVLNRCITAAETSIDAEADLAGFLDALQNLDSLGFALILGVGEELARDLGHFIKEALLCLQEGLPVIRQVLPYLQQSRLHVDSVFVACAC